MIALIYRHRKLDYEPSGIAICEVRFSIISAIGTSGRFSSLFNGGMKKYKVIKILYSSKIGDSVDELNDLKLNKDTVFTNKYKIISKLFEFNGEI